MLLQVHAAANAVKTDFIMTIRSAGKARFEGTMLLIFSRMIDDYIKKDPGSHLRSGSRDINDHL
jgi:hypothetical protein